MTFMLFPALSFEKKMDMNITWSILIFNLMYNIGDTFGKTIADIRKLFNSYSVFYLFLARLFFYYTIPIMDTRLAQDDTLLNNNIFPFINQLLFGISNGFVISNNIFNIDASFILSFETCPN